ncbi:hypothetical protein ATCC90586_011660 [Pythium insidiosum]|nr:hypothetical protein ATCC90586_011660 [Pythium insidiosum]
MNFYIRAYIFPSKKPADKTLELPRLDMTQTIGVVLSRWVFKSRASSARHTHVERLWFAKFLLWAYYLGHALAALVFVVPPSHFCKPKWRGS